MRENKISIHINRPLADVFIFIITPSNTPKWILEYQKEQTNEWPIKKGSHYKNLDQKGIWAEYVVANIQLNEIFELVSLDGSYHVRYSFISLSPGSTFVEYFEWVNEGDIQKPFTVEQLRILKEVIEI